MSQGAQINGPTSPSGKFIDSIDPEDPEYIRNLQRPAEVKEDMKQMEGRSRVSVVLNSQAFKEELEQIIHEQIRQGGPASIFALQQISDLLLPASRGGSSFGRSSPVIPINDIRGVETFGYSKQEKVLRCKLAACYRLVDIFGWTHGIFNHISARVSQDQEQFLLNPFGMLYPEITASTLVKVDVKGDIVDTGSTGLGINKAGFTLHSAIHQARPDIRCVIHLHTPSVVAVSATKRGLLAISQEAMACGKISYHSFRGIVIDPEEREQLSRNLGPFNKVMFLRNHGVVACGETIEEAFHYAFNVMAACDTQVKAMPVGLDNLVEVDEETQERTFKVMSQGGGGADTSGRKWRTGELEWDALMRTLDNSGYRTGHVYKQPLMKQEKKERTNSDVEVPPASSSFTYIFDGDYEHSKYVSPIKTAMERQKQAYKAGWLTSPNTYKKQEIEEIGTTTPKKITKWVTDGENQMQRSTAIKVDSPNVFAPQGANPKEFKQKQKSIRKDYYEEKVTAGPQSKILEGISWDEAAKMKEGGDQTVIVGAASKGIIQRDHQHNAVVYRSYYAANPFENMSEDDVIAYKQEVERRERGEEPEDVPGPDGRLISTEERMQNIQHSREDVQHDTEANTTQETNNDSFATEEPTAKPERTPQEVAPAKECAAGDPPFHLPSQQGVDQLVERLVQAALASTRPESPTQGQCFQGDAGAPTRGRTASPTPQPPTSPTLLSEDRPTQEFPPQTHPDRSVPAFPSPSSDQFIPTTWVSQADQAEGPVTTSVRTQAEKLTQAEGRRSGDAPEMMTVQLEPLKLFQGKPGDGVMKISFTIQSKVTRRRTKGPKASWPVENVTIMQSQPKVVVVQPEDGQQPPGKTRVLQEQQNVMGLPAGQAEGSQTPVVTVPLHLPYQQRGGKKQQQAAGRRRGNKLSRPRKKLRWMRRGLTHPLSPVKEEFVEGDESLEDLLARQNVELDSDESLEDLLMMTDNYKENLVPSHRADTQATPPHASHGSAPIAVLDELDETGGITMATREGDPPHCQEAVSTEHQEEPVFIVPKVPLSSSSSRYSRSVPPPVPHQSQGEGGLNTQLDLEEEALELEKLKDDDEENIKFADEEISNAISEEISNTFSEASDGDISPRKHDGQSGRGQMPLVDLQRDITPVQEENDTEEEKEETGSDEKRRLEDEADDQSEEDTESSDSETKDDVKDTVRSETPLEQQQTKTVEAERTVTLKERVMHEVPLKLHPFPRVSSAPLIHNPLILEEGEMISVSPPVISPTQESATKEPLYRTDSASLENSPVVKSPPFDALSPDPIHREIHRVRSLENELDEPSGVKIRPKKGHSVVRRVQSAGPAPHRPASENRNVAVIDAVLHTVTIDPAKIAGSGQSIATYLGSQGKETSSAEDKKKWTLMDSVSKSLEDLDVDSLAKEGAVIYGRSLEIVIKDNVLPEDAPKAPSKSQSLEDLLEDPEEAKKLTKKGSKVYQDDVVVITKKPLEFSAISPQARKDIAEEEGPLVTSSPKLGRRRDGSFKKYQSKMGKSEETLLEVTPLSGDKAHQTAKRSTSFPKNYGLMKNRSRDTLLDDHPSLTGADGETKGSSQSMPVLDETPPRQGGRKRRNRHTLTGGVLPGEHAPPENRMQQGASRSRTLERSRERRRSKERVLDDVQQAPEPGEEKMSRDSLSQPPSERPRRRRRRGQPEEDSGPGPGKDGNAEGDVPRSRSAGRERRRRRRERSRGEAGEDREEAADTVAGGERVEQADDRDREPHAAPLDTKDRESPPPPPAVEIRGGETPPPPPVEDFGMVDVDDLPPPPEELLRMSADQEMPQLSDTGKDANGGQIDVEQYKDEDEENRPPKVRKPQKKAKDSQRSLDDVSKTQGKGRDAEEPQAQETVFLSTFQQPKQPLETLGEHYPSLSASLTVEVSDSVANEEKARVKDAEPNSMGTVEGEGTVPIAGNLDIIDYDDDEPFRVRKSRRKGHLGSSDDLNPSRSRRQGDRRIDNNDYDDDQRDMGSMDRKSESRRNRSSRDNLSRSSRDNLSRSSRDNLSRAPRDNLSRASRDNLSRAPRDNLSRASRDNLSRASRDNLSRASRDNLSRASRDNLSRSSRDNLDSRKADADMMELDEPPRARRAGHTSMPDQAKLDREAGGLGRPRVRGRRELGSNTSLNQDRARRGRQREDQDVPPQIKIQAASRESLDREDTAVAPPLPPKKHRSMEQLAEYDLESHRSRSQEVIARQGSNGNDAPPELPPKKNKLKKLSCVGGAEMDREEARREGKKSKERSASKDRKKMPPPPSPPASPEKEYSEEPRRRGGRPASSQLLQVPLEYSRPKERSFDASFDTQPSHRHRDADGNSPAYYGDTEDELDDPQDNKKDWNSNPPGDVTLSPPQTPRPARKISTSSFGSVATRPARSVSFDDGYTPTMSHPPQRRKSRESMASESSFHSTGYRGRSLSAASETSVSSNPLTYEPWRVKAAAQRAHTRPRRSRSQGEATYSANSGRRRRSRMPSAGDSNRLYQPRRSRSRNSLPDAPLRPAAPPQYSQSRGSSMLADDSFSDAFSHGYASEVPPVPVRRSESERHPEKSRELIRELERKGVGRSKSDRRSRGEGDGDKPGSPTKSDPMDSASGGETLEERSSKEGSPTKEAPSPTKDKKKKKKFRMPSFSKKKKDSKESTI